jgi:hypothetical protein
MIRIIFLSRDLFLEEKAQIEFFEVANVNERISEFLCFVRKYEFLVIGSAGENPLSSAASIARPEV